MNTHTDINELKASGAYFAAGVRAAQQGLPDAYGAHFGAHTSLSFARSEFSKGWHSVEALAAALCAYEDAVARNADTSVVFAALTAYSNLVTAAAERRAAAAVEAAQEAGYAVRESAGDVTPTADELVAVAALNSWLVEHYEQGAHWIVETTSDEEHVAKLRELGMAAYRAELREEWELTESYADDIRNS
jgi:hypothetical protein